MRYTRISSNYILHYISKIYSLFYILIFYLFIIFLFILFVFVFGSNIYYIIFRILI